MLSGVLHDLYVCFLEEKAVPQRVYHTPLSKRFLKGYHGEVRSWDDAFGKPTRYGTHEEGLSEKLSKGGLLRTKWPGLRQKGARLNEEEFDGYRHANRRSAENQGKGAFARATGTGLSA